MKRIAFFDFDGTITTRDSMLELIRFHKGNFKFYLGFLLLSPFLVAMKLGIITNQSAKEKMLAWFFGGMSINDFNEACMEFSKNRLPSIIRPGALQMIHDLKSQNVEVVIVSASANNWVEPWCRLHELQIVATCLETRDGRLTGKITGKNCHGLEKVRRIRELFNLADYKMIQCFGDTSGDKHMLALAHEAFYKPFRNY